MTSHDEDIKFAMERAKRAKELNKSSDSNLRADDMLFIVHKDEADVLEDVIIKILTNEVVNPTPDEKKKLLSVLKFIQS